MCASAIVFHYFASHHTNPSCDWEISNMLELGRGGCSLGMNLGFFCKFWWSQVLLLWDRILFILPVICLAQFRDVFHLQMCIMLLPLCFRVEFFICILFHEILDKGAPWLWVYENIFIFWVEGRATFSFLVVYVPTSSQHSYLYSAHLTANLLCINIKLCENFAVEFMCITAMISDSFLQILNLY